MNYKKGVTKVGCSYQDFFVYFLQGSFCLNKNGQCLMQFFFLTVQGFDLIPRLTLRPVLATLLSNCQSGLPVQSGLAM